MAHCNIIDRMTRRKNLTKILCGKRGLGTHERIPGREFTGEVTITVGGRRLANGRRRLDCRGGVHD